MVPSCPCSHRVLIRFAAAVLLWGPDAARAQNDMPTDYPENVSQVLSTTWSPDQPATYGLGLRTRPGRDAQTAGADRHGSDDRAHRATLSGSSSARDGATIRDVSGAAAAERGRA